jgi:hypothetical protein
MKNKNVSFIESKMLQRSQDTSDGYGETNRVDEKIWTLPERRKQSAIPQATTRPSSLKAAKADVVE